MDIFKNVVTSEKVDTSEKLDTREKLDTGKTLDIDVFKKVDTGKKVNSWDIVTFKLSNSYPKLKGHDLIGKITDLL